MKTSAINVLNKKIFFAVLLFFHSSLLGSFLSKTSKSHEQKSQHENLQTLQQDLNMAAHMGTCDAAKDRAYKKATQLSQEEQEAEIKAAVKYEHETKLQKLSENNKQISLDHAKFLGTLAAATSVAGQHFTTKESRVTDSMWSGIHHGITKSFSVLVNTAIVAIATYLVSRVYHFFSEMDEKKRLPETLKILVQNKKQEIAHKQKIMLQNDMITLKKQSDILAMQCMNAQTEEELNICATTRAEILRQNLNNLLHCARLTVLNQY